jgi:non-ribosomal peptide synthetase component F
MKNAEKFWLDLLLDHNIDRCFSLPFDRYRLPNEHRTTCGISTSFYFNEDISENFLHYSLSNNITSECLLLSIYYIFLFKLTNGENDLCIGIDINNRYEQELMSIIGLFINTIPLKCHFDSNWSFTQLLFHVHQMMTNTFHYSYFPIHRISHQQQNSIFFRFQSNITKNRIMIDNRQLYSLPSVLKIDENETIMVECDFLLHIEHNPDNNQFLCKISGSLDLFNLTTISRISQRFHLLLEQLFLFPNNQINKPIYEFSLLLSDEKLLMKTINNTQISFPSSTCVHHELTYQVMKYSQKISVELDDQSLTYAELLYYSQILSLNLLNNYHIISGDIIYQCVERSLSMVSL